MPTSSENNPMQKIIDQSKTLAHGTAIGLVSRWATWPLENAYYEASNPANLKTYFKIYRDIHTWPILKKLNILFLTTGYMQTIGRSVSNMGVIASVEQNYPHLTPLQTGLLSAMYVSPLDTALTSRGEYRKVQSFTKLQKGCSLPIMTNRLWSVEFGRVLSASFIRNLWSSVITFGGIYKTAELIKPLFPKDLAEGPIVKTTAALLSAFTVQPIIMPIINFQTIVLDNPNKPLLQTSKDFLASHYKNKLVGCLGRSICQSTRYGISFFLLESLKKKEEDNKAHPIIKKHYK